MTIPSMDVLWEWESSGYDVEFSIVFVSAASSTSEEIIIADPTRELLGTGIFEATGSFLFVFFNLKFQKYTILTIE